MEESTFVGVQKSSEEAQHSFGLKKSKIECIEEGKKTSFICLHYPSPKLALLSANRDYICLHFSHEERQ